MPLHLLFPLASSFGFVLAMLFTKQATSRGASPWTGTFLANLWLALGWGLVFTLQEDRLPMEGWWQAALIGAAFVVGQLLTYLAFGKPVISTRCPGLSPAYEDVLTFLAREDENCLADTLREVLAWPAARLVAVRQRIAAFAESHTWLEQAGRLLAWMATVSR